jgi:hypothetical protein
MAFEGSFVLALRTCVFFAQHLVEKRHEGLWEWPFFIA